MIDYISYGQFLIQSFVLGVVAGFGVYVDLWLGNRFIEKMMMRKYRKK